MMRQYLFLSPPKLMSIAQGRREKVFHRIRDVGLSFAGAEGKLSLADPAVQTLIDSMDIVASKMRPSLNVLDYTDLEVEPGRWIAADGLQMAYGVQRSNKHRDLAAAIFSSEEPRRRLMLVGSARHLLDRSHQAVGHAESVSDPQSMFEFINSFLDPANDSGNSPPTINSPGFTAGISALHASLAIFGQQPLSSLSRVTNVFNIPGRARPIRQIIASPICVTYGAN